MGKGTSLSKKGVCGLSAAPPETNLLTKTNFLKRKKLSLVKKIF